MWGFQSKRDALREQLLLQAPEANPSEFVRRYLLQKTSSPQSGGRIRLKQDANPTETARAATQIPER